jgi:O-antigen/teichoic acid export membrane protein
VKRSVAISIADQGMLSLFNLGLNACLVAVATPLEFGHYVYAGTVVLVLTSIQNALVATPLSVVYPRRSAADQVDLRAVILGFDVLFQIVAGCLAVALCMLTETDPWFLTATAVLVIATLARETQRNLAIADGRVTDLLRIDAVSVAISIAATPLLWIFARPSVAALAGCAAGSVAAVWLAGYKRATGEPRLGIRSMIAGYTPLWADTRWSLVGAATTEVQNRAYVFMLEVFRTARDIAEVQAGRLLMGPLPLLVGAWTRIARPALARCIEAGDRRGILRIVGFGLAGMVGAGIVFAGVLYTMWPLIERTIFRGRYPDVAIMTAAWTIYTLLMISHMVLSAPLVAGLRLRELSQVTVATALLSVVALLGLALPTSPLYAVGVGIVCELIALSWIAVLVRRMFLALPHAQGPTLQDASPIPTARAHGVSQ